MIISRSSPPLAFISAYDAMAQGISSIHIKMNFQKPLGLLRDHFYHSVRNLLEVA